MTQAANLRALKGGVTTDRNFELVRKLHHDIREPIVFMALVNGVFSYGAIYLHLSRHGKKGRILPDLTFQEKKEFLPFHRKYGVDVIFLIASTSQNRIVMIAAEAESFLYVV